MIRHFEQRTTTSHAAGSLESWLVGPHIHVVSAQEHLHWVREKVIHEYNHYQCD
jgi:hypothetical protein